MGNESEKLSKASFGAMAGVFLSRASGVLRTFVINVTFGIGLPLDAFNAAFRFPNSLRDLFADGALSSAFIKSLVDAKEKGIEEERKLISIVVGFFSAVTFLIAILGCIYSYPIMEFITDEKFKATGSLPMASFLFKILAFYLPFTMLNAVAMAILGVLGQTFRAMNGSIFLSFGMIIGALVLSPYSKHIGQEPIYGLAIGSLIGVFLQMFYQVKPLISLKLFPLPNFNLKTWLSYKPLREILILMLPRAVGQGALTIALLINTMFAIQIGKGVLTYIVTAMIIIQVPIGLFGVATGFAAQPMLAKALCDKDSIKFKQLLLESLNTSLWLATMTTACFALFIVPFYTVLFQHGKVTSVDTIQNSIAVCIYSIGIIFSSGSKVFLNAFYALNSTRRIIYNAVVYLCINATLSYLLAPRFGIIGLGLSYGISTALDFLLNFYFIKKITQKKELSKNIYLHNNKNFYFDISIFTILSFGIAFLGIALIHTFWKNFSFFFNTNLTMLLSAIILLIGGSLYAIFCLLLVNYYGPDSLKNFILKLKKRIV